MYSKTSIIQASNHMQLRSFESQPMPISYSKPFARATSRSPTVMMEAFVRGVLNVQSVHIKK